MKQYDIVVIGAGPAGSMAALTASQLGLEVLLVERDKVIGSPVRCAEGVDDVGLRKFFTPDPRWISAEITRYYLIAPDGSPVEMNTGNARGYILDRTIFDHMIAEKAGEEGTEILTSVDAVGLSPFENGYRIVSLKDAEKKWAVQARVIIAADGVESRAGRWAGIATHCSPRDMECCAQVVMAGIDIDPHAFSLYFTGEFAPEGYAWVFPKGDGSANIGLGISGKQAEITRPVQHLKAFCSKYFPSGTVVRRTIGGVPCSGGIKKLIADGLMVCGDAGHMANPITGGGIINGMLAGQFAGDTASEALKKGKTDERTLTSYEKRCNDSFGKMNRRFYRIKNGILTIPDDRLNDIAREILTLPISKRTPVRVLTSALKHNPSLIPLLAKIIL